MPKHYATITPAKQAYRVYFGDELLFETQRVLELVEHMGERAFPAVPYFAPPLESSSIELRSNDAESRCPLKGVASYFDFRGVSAAIWSYAQPLDAVTPIAGHYGFDTSKGFRVEPVS